MGGKRQHITAQQILHDSCILYIENILLINTI